MTFDLNLPDAAATARLGAALAAGVLPGRVLHLSGELGSGKTTLVRGLLRSLGIQGAVKSPTYAWVEPYRISSLDLYHFDFYRFDKKTEWLSSGLREYFRPDAVCIVEWPERAGSLLSSPDLAIRLTYEDDARQASVEAHSAEGEAWLASLRASLASS
jgi:tRNA threonylcarbamoyladenosine biosynthesis protein TsaE